MKRKALIVYCDNTKSGNLPGPSHDYSNFVEFLTSPLGGGWYEHEILGLHNPTEQDIMTTGYDFLAGADYTFTIFTGHGYIQKSELCCLQYVELADKNVSIRKLKSTSPRQLLIIDACRKYQFVTEKIKKIASAYESMRNFSSITEISRQLFDEKISNSECGITVLYAASKNETALDTDNGAAYLLSLLDAAKGWENESTESILSIKDAHLRAKEILDLKFGDDTTQHPIMNQEKRKVYFPFAVNPQRFIIS